MNRILDFIAHTDSAGLEFLWETILFSGVQITWYYKQPWEKWADSLGGVERY